MLFSFLTPEQFQRMEDGVWDLSSIAEEDFDQLAVYLVPDQACDDTTHTSAANRAEASLPRNLILKPSQTLSDVSILSKNSDFSPLSVYYYRYCLPVDCQPKVYAKIRISLFKYLYQNYFWQIQVNCVSN